MNRTGIILILLTILLLLVAYFLPDAEKQQVADKNPYLSVLFVLMIVVLLANFPKFSGISPVQKVNDVGLLIFIALMFSELVFAKLAVLDPFLFPSPARVFLALFKDIDILLDGLVSSITLLAAGYLLAVITAIPLGLITGWKKRLFNAAYPFAKAVSPIPPTVYLPYSIVLLPSFKAASVFVIFIGAFWPIFVATVYGVFNIEPRLINSARTLGLGNLELMRRVVLPAALPTIFSGALIALILSFITLTVAEMIGTNSGLGWYIEYEHQFANYDKLLAGMLFLGFAVVSIMFVFDRVQSYCLRWQKV
ncbi:MAG TPA: ABC transporter permease [Candidatus Methanoperedenaceae archaeon]|nr:ABC transporter permease [Candidatus Methanoperedenaceae archaeon]